MSTHPLPTAVAVAIRPATLPRPGPPPTSSIQRCDAGRSESASRSGGTSPHIPAMPALLSLYPQPLTRAQTPGTAHVPHSPGKSVPGVPLKHL
jgi:hypothetical protein